MLIADPIQKGTPARADLLLGGVLSAALITVALVTGSGVLTGSGTDLGGNTWTEIALTLLGAGAIVAVLLYGARGPAWGAGPLLAFTGMVALTALSIIWSFQPDASWTVANQSIAFLAVFAIGLSLARLLPGRWAGVIGAVAALAVFVGAFSLLAKVFHGLTGSDDTLGRLTAPLGYWNAVGLVAAMGVAPCLWLGSAPGIPRFARAATVPGIAVLVPVLILSYSRSALVVAMVALALWFALVPTRLRAAALLLPGLAGGAVISGWMLRHPALSGNGENVHPAAQASAGHTLGIVLVLVLLAMAGAGVVCVRLTDTRQLTDRARSRIGLALLGLASLIPLGAVAALAASSRGLTGEISHLWTTLTSTSGYTGTTVGRITTLSNSRPAYWHAALTIWGHHLLVGVGALGYATARAQYVFDARPVQNAHSFVFETLSDFGLAGLVTMVALLAAWARAAWRPVGPCLRRLAPGSAGSVDAEGAGALTLLTVILCFGLQSAIDWTWYIPATALPALLCAGWLAGRGPLDAPIGMLQRRRAVLSRPTLPVTITAVAVITLALMWTVWQPLRSAQSDNAVITAPPGQALADAQAAVTEDPLSLSAMSELSALRQGAGNLSGARAELVQETRTQPNNYQSWLALGSFDLQRHHDLLAQHELTVAHALNLADYGTLALFTQAVDAVNRMKFGPHK